MKNPVRRLLAAAAAGAGAALMAAIGLAVADLYLAGHDHNRQFLQSTCGTEFIVSGAAAKLTEDNARGNPVWFEDYESEGFVWIEIADDTMTVAFYDRAANLQYEQTLTK